MNLWDQTHDGVFQNFDSIEVCQKSMFQVELVKRGGHTAFGFSIEAELAEDSERDDELQVYVSDVQRGGLADLKGKGTRTREG